MSRIKKKVEPFTLCPKSLKGQTNLSVFTSMKKVKEFSAEGLSGKCGLDTASVKACIEGCVKTGLIEQSSSGVFTRKKDPVTVLGVGFSNENCLLTLMDRSGMISRSEKVEISPLSKFKGKKKEILSILDSVKCHTGLSKSEVSIAGVAVPEEVYEAGEDKHIMLAEGIGRIFSTDVYYGNVVTASGYGEMDYTDTIKGRDILYLHSDIGSGVVIKNELIYEAGEEGASGKSPYLRSWGQFGVVGIARELVSKGVGTSIVNMVNGNVGEITLDVVLKAAEDQDELAEDIVKRSALALGVRAAYLANIFSTPVLVLGGGTEDNRGKFADFVKESAGKFLTKELSGKVEIVGGKLGIKASSFGAASLCIRELFMEG